MKASEIRLGNYLQFGDYELEVDINVIRDFYVYKQNGLKPIPLTEDILLKCGFDVITNVNDFTENYWNKQKDCSINVETYVFNGKIERLYKYRIFETKRLKSIIYLHQLQNLYFALTGEELNINF